jgi:DNA-binding LacI/PurR family transcriptional regulator
MTVKESQAAGRPPLTVPHQPEKLSAVTPRADDASRRPAANANRSSPDPRPRTGAAPAEPGAADAEGQGTGGGTASIRDVARWAGVSHQTVSRVINGHPNVRDATRRRVQRVISQLGFRPNRAARALSLGTSRAVTVITSNTTLYGRASILHGVADAARNAGFSVGVYLLDSAEPDAVRTAIERSCDPTAGGVIVIAYDLAGVRALHAIPAGIRVAAALEVNDTHSGRRYPSVTLDDRSGAGSATRYLLDLGHRTVHYVAIPTSTDASSRMQGWHAALQTAGAAIPDVVPGGWTPQTGYRAGRQLAADPDVTAVLCGNDDLALGVLHALREAGRDVPAAVSVVGFDDIPQAAFYTPPLTTVRLDFAGVGRACFALLHNAMDPTIPHQPPPAAAPQLVVRASTGHPPLPQSP